MEQGSTSRSSSDGNGYGNFTLQPKHKVFLSHSGAQKGFVEQLCVDLERRDRYPFFDKHRDCLPIGKEFPSLIFEAIEQCEVGVVVLSEEFFTSKWPMLELVAMAKKRKPSFTIMPIFLGITFSQCCDVDKHKSWLSLWHTWAECDSRIDVQDWENVLRLFGPINGLKYNCELGEVKFREEIVEAICKLIPRGTRFEDSHVQGRSRLCKVIHEKIERSKVSSFYGMRIIGLYGVGGIGKTTICKAMCNDLLEVYRDKVCHVELGSRSEEEVFKKVLGELSDKNFDYLGAMDVDKYGAHLKRDMMNVKVFLTIDNVSSATSEQALTLLRAKYGFGSVLLVTARSLNELTSLGIDASECIEMPELELEEARSIFFYHVACILPTYSSNKDDLDLISRCVKRCYFKKGDRNSYHYHPLALQVLGEQFRCVGYDPSQWSLLLDEIDFLNPFGEPQHPVFSILRRSFDALKPEDQLLFMDVALFAPDTGVGSLFRWNVFEWLGMVHGLPLNSVMKRLENLKRKSLLDNLGDGLDRIGMHDLWHEFARLETKVGKFEDKRWIFEWDGEGSLTWVGGLVNVRRMFFFDKGFMKLKDVDFVCFSNVTVLNLCGDFTIVEDLDLGGLKLLKSLEFECQSSKPLRSIVGLHSLTKLVFLRWFGVKTHSSCIAEIGCLTNLQVLYLCACGRIPNMSKLISLQIASFPNNGLMASIDGLSLKHTNLRILNLSSCGALQSCWGVDELVALEELDLGTCQKLKMVPNLQKLKRLRELDVSHCYLLRALPGLGDLVSLVKLNTSYCYSLVEMPYMGNLKNLRTLDLSHCHLMKSLQGLDELVCLQSLQTTGCKKLSQLPNIYKLTSLQTLKLDLEAHVQSFEGWNNLISLRSLVVGIDDLHDGSNFCNLTMLERLHISRCQGEGISSLVELVLLESIIVDNCKDVRVFPDLKRLSRLHSLEFTWCEFEDWSNLCNLPNLEFLKITFCHKLEVLPDLQKLTKLVFLQVEFCALLRDLHGIFGLQNLKTLWMEHNPMNPWNQNLGLDLPLFTSLCDLQVSDCIDLQWLATCSQLDTLHCYRCPIQELPDLAKFPKLTRLELPLCVNLRNMTCSVPLCPDFWSLNINGCKKLQVLPDFTNVRGLVSLDVANSGVVLSAQLIQDMRTRWPYIYLVTNETSSLVPSQTSSRGIWSRTIGMIASLHCGCWDFLSSYSL